jgi:hypothetical protein
VPLARATLVCWLAGAWLVPLGVGTEVEGAPIAAAGGALLAVAGVVEAVNLTVKPVRLLLFGSQDLAGSRFASRVGTGFAALQVPMARRAARGTWCESPEGCTATAGGKYLVCSRCGSGPLVAWLWPVQLGRGKDE